MYGLVYFEKPLRLWVQVGILLSSNGRAYMKFNTFSGSRSMNLWLVSLSCIMIVTCVITSEEQSKTGWYTSMCAFKTRALLRIVWPASRLTRTPLARRRWQRSFNPPA